MVVNVKQQNFGHYVDPYTRKKARVKKITMTNEKNISVSVLTLGALIHSVKVPDSCGNIADVCLGFDDIQGYRENQASYFGATIGRVANRIGCGRFNLGGKEIELTRNFKDKYHYNGGLVGFDCVNWKILSINPAGVTMEFVSHDGKEGYPGDLTAKIEYSLADNGALRIIMEATASQTTIVNMTNNTYFNLAGHAAGKDALGAHCLMIKADRIVDTDLQQLPTGSLMPIKNTPYDFRQITNLGQRIRKLRDCPIHGFDNCFCVDPPANRTALIAKIVHSCSGRWMEVHSNQPALYFYTANNMPDAENGSAPLIGRDGANYVKHCAFVVSTQKYPDAPNNINFQSIAINPGEKYVHECVYRFGFCLKK